MDSHIILLFFPNPIHFTYTSNKGLRLNDVCIFHFPHRNDIDFAKGSFTQKKHSKFWAKYSVSHYFNNLSL